MWASAVLMAGSVFFASVCGSNAQSADAPREFDIPSQPLETALSRYGDVTGREALYDTRVGGSRVSGDVQGRFTPNEALARLLAGTGLSARFVAEDSFVVLPAPPIQPSSSPSVRRHYYAIIQQNLLAALCRSGARPGRYRIVAMFWISATGKIENSQRIGSTGAADADRQIDATLQRVKFSEPPPAGFEQPVLILIVPQLSSAMSDCGSANSVLDPTGNAP